MGTTEPVKDSEELKEWINYYKTARPMPRNYMLMLVGLHTALRISDVLKLKWEDVYDFKKECMKDHISIQEKKTKKHTTIAMNTHLKQELITYKNLRNPQPEHYLFTKNTNFCKPISRTQAFRIIKTAAEETIGKDNISCHSLRKSFGYHAWKQGTPPALLMDIFNHSSYEVTKHYLGIDQDEKDSVFRDIEF